MAKNTYRVYCYDCGFQTTHKRDIANRNYFYCSCGKRTHANTIFKGKLGE